MRERGREGGRVVPCIPRKRFSFNEKPLKVISGFFSSRIPVKFSQPSSSYASGWHTYKCIPIHPFSAGVRCRCRIQVQVPGIVYRISLYNLDLKSDTKSASTTPDWGSEQWIVVVVVVLVSDLYEQCMLYICTHEAHKLDTDEWAKKWNEMRWKTTA